MLKISTAFLGIRYPFYGSLRHNTIATRFRSTDPPYKRKHSGQASTVEKQGHQMIKEDQDPEEDTSRCFDDRFPKLRYIQVKEKGRRAEWKSHLQRRVWFTFESSKPTEEELALQWRKEKKSVSYRALQDYEESSYRYNDTSRVFTVIEKLDSKRRTFWREVIKAGESTDEEEGRG